MKKLLSIYAVLCLLAGTATITYYGCKKKEKESCTDGIQNQTETGVDCGGPCTACPPPSNNHIKVGSTDNAWASKSCGISSGRWTPQGSFGSGGTFFIYTGLTAAPSASTTFTLKAPASPTNIPTLAANEAYIYCNNTTEYESYAGGTVSVSISGGVTSVTFSGTLHHLNTSGASIVVNMALTCQ